MQGEFRGDFSRDTFDPLKQYSRVLMQQGRVLLDADWNEQTSILLHFLRTLTVDLIGPHGGPDRRSSSNSEPMDFEIKVIPGGTDFEIGNGHYYVNGFLCENSAKVQYTKLPNAQSLESNKPYLVYLDVWERHITSIDNDEIREIALNGPDTATRAQVVWQIGITYQYPYEEGYLKDIPTNPGLNTPWKHWVEEQWPEWVGKPANRGQLKARAKEAEPKATDPCNIPPEARYRGENQLYRVEIHKGGKVSQNPTFKWSRDNSAVEFSIKAIAPSTDSSVVTVADLGRDERLSLREGDWVEIVDEASLLANLAEPLLQVLAVDRVMSQVTLSGKPVGDRGKGKLARLRRWDHRADDPKNNESLIEGAVALKVANSPNSPNDWLQLEDGIQIQFQPGGEFRTGDYWLIPARSATGDVEWPGPLEKPDAIGPHGIDHYYAPLALISNGGVTDCRRLWKPLGI